MRHSSDCLYCLPKCTFVVEFEKRSEEGRVEQCKVNSYVAFIHTEEVRVRNEKSYHEHFVMLLRKYWKKYTEILKKYNEITNKFLRIF